MSGSKPHSAHDLAETFLRTPMTLHSRENVQLVARTFLDLEEQLKAAEQSYAGCVHARTVIASEANALRDQLESTKEQLEVAREALRDIAEHGACASDARVARAAYGPLYPEASDPASMQGVLNPHFSRTGKYDGGLCSDELDPASEPEAS